MRAIVARKLRRIAYGAGHHPGPVRYYKDSKGTVTADMVRQTYQRLKQEYKETNK